MIRSLASVSALLLVTASGCAAPGHDESETVATSAQELGTTDTTHVNAGALVRRSPSGVVARFCSGILVSPTVFLTAGHCTESAAAYAASGFAVGVSFDLTIGNASPVITGTPHTNPAYNPAAYNLNNDTQDLGVLVLDTPVTDRAPQALPSANVLVANRPAPGSAITAVGYGVDPNGASGGNVTYVNSKTRQSGTLSFRALTAYVTAEQIGANGVCFGDSGGPDFMQIGGQEQLVAISVLVNGYDCNQIAWLQRLDTAPSRAFLGQYVTLP